MMEKNLREEILLPDPDSEAGVAKQDQKSIDLALETNKNSILYATWS